MNLKTALILGLVLCLAACRPAEETLRSGDLIFVGLSGNGTLDEDRMGSAISASTGDGVLNLIHVAIAEVQADSVFVIDATEELGVARRPLGEFLEDFAAPAGTMPQLFVKRLRKCPDELIDAALERAKGYCGRPYDMLFQPGDEALYCSELVRECYLTAGGDYLFEESPMNWKDAQGRIPSYWQQHFESLGAEIPQGVPGTNPQAMASSPLLIPVNGPAVLAK
ncbi:MAG: hypothetical protein J1D85_07805 [Bacteroidales bacterium]|nr:hypothetical protein [Bacteroidales bacterium]